MPQTKRKGLKIKRTKAACFLGAVALSLVIIWGAAVVSLGQNSVEATTTYDEEETDLAYLTGQKMKVLVIEINPHLNTLPGNPKASDVIHGVTNLVETAVDTQVNDLEWSSGGYLDIETTWEYIDEFPRYKNSFERPDGTEGFAFDEENFLAAADDGSGNYSWFNLLYNDWFSNTKIQDHNFDYGWIINKLDLINRRNNGEFDQVWIASIDPTQLFESMMVGRTAYWINGTPYEADCDNFIIDELSLSRGDSRLHAFGHGIENIMGKLYGMDYNAYGKDSISVSTTEEYLGLNLWERFMLNDYANSGTLNGVGTVHHPFTSSGDYDYSNDVFVNSTYLEWKNKSIENMTGESTLANHLVWDSEPYNDGGDNLSGGRYWMRMWFSLFPREAGYTSDGYLKNWWKYVVSGDFVENITTNSNTTYDVVVGNTIELPYTLEYWSEKNESGSIKSIDSNIAVSNKSVVDSVDGRLKALSVGESKVTMYRDGKKLEYTVIVSLVHNLSLNKNDGSGGSNSYSCNTGGELSCGISLKNYLPVREGYKFLGWADSPSAVLPDYTINDSVELSSDKTLYAVWEIITTDVALSFDLNGAEGEGVPVQSCVTSILSPTCDVTIPNTIPSRNGYDFLGWAENDSATSATYSVGDKVTLNDDKTLYAVWAPRYTLVIDDNTGELLEEETIVLECYPETTDGTCSVFIPEDELVREGYEFVGYGLDADADYSEYLAGDKYVFDYGVNNVILYAVWSEDSIIVPNTGTTSKNDSENDTISTMFSGVTLMMLIIVAGMLFGKRHKEHRVFDR